MSHGTAHRQLRSRSPAPDLRRGSPFVVVSDGATVSEQDVKAHVKANLARYKVPRDVVFLDELPRNATGKVVKRELAGL
ncbi:hypothetical protein BH20ACT16_BH20ACT16_03060 [soil metagenome]|jgi:fatty-acyl-CoA synthase